MKVPWLQSFCVDVQDGCPDIPDASCDVAFFSPPYKKADGYSDDLMFSLGQVLVRVMKPGGRIFLNFGFLRESLGRPYEAMGQLVAGSWWNADTIGHVGFDQGTTIAWVKSAAFPSWRELILEYLKGLPRGSSTAATSVLRKILREPGRMTQRGHYQPITGTDKVLNYCWEPVFTLWKPPEPDFDRLAVGVPFTHKSNQTRGTRGQYGDLHCAGDVWFIPHKTTGKEKKKKHKHEFPEALVERVLKVSGVPVGGTVFDPFLGSGTTAVVAKRLGLNVYGTDKDRRELRVARTRWAKEV